MSRTGLFSIFVMLFLIVLTVIFALQNAASVTVGFFLWEYSASLALILIITFIIGIISGMLLLVRTILKLRSQLNQVKRDLRNEKDKNSVIGKDDQD